MSKVILHDSTLCIGCKACEGACAERWGLLYNDTIAAEEKISAHELTAIETHYGKLCRRLCMNCLQPACVSVCPVGALQKTALGPVMYDTDKCMGCRYCMQACPFQVPSYKWSSRLPKMRKCNMCYERQSAGKQTACAEACPVGATLNGDRDELIAEAKRRIVEKPDRYYRKIYGVQEVGGTSVFYLSSVSFAQIGLRTNVSQEPLPETTWRVLELVPDVVSTGTVLLGWIYWVTKRGAKIEEQVRRKTAELERVHKTLLHSEKMASIGKVTATVAHEIINPLFGILTYARLVLRELLKHDIPGRDDLAEQMQTIERKSKRCGELVKSLLSFSRQAPSIREPNDLNTVVHRAVVLVQHKLAMQNIDLQENLGSDMPPVLCDANQIQQVVLVLMMNAAEAMPKGGRLAVPTEFDSRPIRV
jgi:formate dehydrogenase iron-sulfur subunit